MGFYTATKKNQVMIHATTYMNIVVKGKKKVTKGKISYDFISIASRIDKYTEMESGCQD